MYRPCRHIQTSGLRCESRALKGSFFCYFHSRLLGQPRILSTGSEPAPFSLPLMEDLASIPIAVNRISEALIADRIDVKKSAQLFWGVKLAYQAILARQVDLPDSVETVTQSADGDDLAPDIAYCSPSRDECRSCQDHKTCADSACLPPACPYSEHDEDDDEDQDDNESSDDSAEEDQDADEDNGEDEYGDEDEEKEEDSGDNESSVDSAEEDEEDEAEQDDNVVNDEEQGEVNNQEREKDDDENSAAPTREPATFAAAGHQLANV